MLCEYQLVKDAWLDGHGLVVVDDERCTLIPEQVLDEYGDRVTGMATAAIEHSDLTTTNVSVAVAGGSVPFIEHPDDRVIEYGRYWPSPN